MNVTRALFYAFLSQKSASFRTSKRFSPKKMDRLRKSFRDSFRRRKDRVPEASKPHQWQTDEGMENFLYHAPLDFNLIY